MKNLVNILLLGAFLFVFLSSGWVSYSAEQKECPTMKSPKDLSRETFMGAHGITAENFSIWLKEHSVWRRENAEELSNYSCIPKQPTQEPEE